MIPTEEIVEKLARAMCAYRREDGPNWNELAGLAREAVPAVQAMLLEARRDEHRAVCVNCDDIVPSGEGPFYCDQELVIERELAALRGKDG